MITLLLNVNKFGRVWSTDGSAKYQLTALDSIEKRGKRLIGDPTLINAKLQTLEHRCRVARLLVFYRIRFGECAKELHKLIPPSTFRHRDTRCGWSFHRNVVDMPPCRTIRFGSSFLMCTAKEWHALPASVLPDQYTRNLNVFKSRVNRLFLARHAPSPTASRSNSSLLNLKNKNYLYAILALGFRFIGKKWLTIRTMRTWIYQSK